jgi:hypothetical protein
MRYDPVVRRILCLVSSVNDSGISNLGCTSDDRLADGPRTRGRHPVIAERDFGDARARVRSECRRADSIDTDRVWSVRCNLKRRNEA